MDKGSFALRQQLEQLYVDHHGWLCNLLRRKLGNACDAADLAHDICLLLLNKGCVPAAQDCRRYLAQIANGKVIDLYRRRQLEARYLDELMQRDEALAPSEEVRALALEALVAVDAALQRQSANSRQALLLHKLNGMAHRDIAAELKVSVSSVEKYIASALRSCSPFSPALLNESH
ncbi:sigma-70 family RNA polymerase sigma factor [Pseudomonas entomophila]|uniref:sigma-70 family RNA polymerase sigma factor n=1 Tax=Pseudomonas entomophila TaxID=312306 RepID=UPI002404FE2F|nr:sigma-70 family RNA polymerase sigma factor [Pseudomonas entomophila]MDF9620158.1 sigma-70 family RNA polymerase sigma factor [Pseudomonas entomophila]